MHGTVLTPLNNAEYKILLTFFFILTSRARSQWPGAMSTHSRHYSATVSVVRAFLLIPECPRKKKPSVSLVLVGHGFGSVLMREARKKDACTLDF